MTGDAATPGPARGFSGRRVHGLVALAILLTGGVTFWFIRSYVHPADFEPVELSQPERIELGFKRRVLGVDPEAVLPGAVSTSREHPLVSAKRRG